MNLSQQEYFNLIIFILRPTNKYQCRIRNKISKMTDDEIEAESKALHEKLKILREATDKGEEIDDEVKAKIKQMFEIITDGKSIFEGEINGSIDGGNQP